MTHVCWVAAVSAKQVDLVHFFISTTVSNTLCQVYHTIVMQIGTICPLLLIQQETMVVT